MDACTYSSSRSSVLMPESIKTKEDADAFLKTYSLVRLGLRKVKGGWVAELMHSHVGSGVRPLPHKPMSKHALMLTLATRYLATVHPRLNVAYVNLDWARRLPNWAGEVGALTELSAAILRRESYNAEGSGK